MRTTEVNGVKPFGNVKKAVKTAVAVGTAAAATGAVVYMAKTGKLNKDSVVVKKINSVIEKAKPHVEKFLGNEKVKSIANKFVKIGDFIVDKFSVAVGFVKEVLAGKYSNKVVEKIVKK